MIPDIDRLRAHRWLNDLNRQRREHGAGHFDYRLHFGSSTIELVERYPDHAVPLVRFRYTKSRSEWRAQRPTPDGRYRAVGSLAPTRYLAELLTDVVEHRARFVPSLPRSDDVLV